MADTLDTSEAGEKTPLERFFAEIEKEGGDNSSFTLADVTAIIRADRDGDRHRYE